ncbi:TlpA family protein disulfide reductase [Kaarinaea lacus]
MSGWFLLFCSITALANTSLQVQLLDEEITVQQFTAPGDQLIIYIAPSYGFNDRGTEFSRKLSAQGVEVWMVDLIDSFFLTRKVESMRQFDGRYVASLIEQAHKITGKKVTLLTSSYGAIPLLKGARQWQINNSSIKETYLNGAILFSPELYMGVPALGEDPEFEPIASATNIPLMIYQSELRNNRWQLENTLKRLEKNNAVVFEKMLPGIVSFFFPLTDKPDKKMSEVLEKVPAEIPKIIKLLQLTPTPLQAANLEDINDTRSVGLDYRLRAYQGKRLPLPLDLPTLEGNRVVRSEYKDKVTVVNFWATWCPPCVEEIPMLNRLQEQMKNDDFELLSVNFGEDQETIRKFASKVKVDFPVLLDEGGRVSGQWNTLILPSTYVIGPDGKFAYTVNAAIEWDSPAVVEAIRGLLDK